MEDGRIEDSQITASSMYSDVYEPRNARLNWAGSSTRGGAWMAGTHNTNQWIQVNFRDLMRVSGVITQARSSASMRVTEFRVLFKSFGTMWNFVKNVADNVSSSKIDLVCSGNTY